MRFPLTLSFLISFWFIASAQWDDILNDPNIPWVAEFELDYSFLIQEKEGHNIVQLKKYLVDPKAETYLYENWLMYDLMDRLWKGDFACYSDKELKKAISEGDVLGKISRIDTIITFDPETYEETIQIVRYDLNPDDVTAIRACQIIYYDDRDDNFKTHLVAFGLLIKGQSKPLFWIKAADLTTKEATFQNPDIQWVSYSLSKNSFLDTKEMKILKGESAFNFQLVTYNHAVLQQKAAETESFNSGVNLLPAEVRTSYVGAIDTITTFDPVTYEEKEQVVERRNDPAGHHEFRLVQAWYYHKTKGLTQKLLAIAPYFRGNDNEGNVRYRYVRYYIRYD